MAPSEPEAIVIASTIASAASARAGMSHQGGARLGGAAAGGAGTSRRPASKLSTAIASATPTGGQSRPSTRDAGEERRPAGSSVGSGRSRGARRA